MARDGTMIEPLVTPAPVDGGAATLPATTVSEALAPTLAHLYAERFRLTPGALAFRCHHDDRGWVEWSWAELRRRAGRYVRAFQHAGLSPGDRVGVHLVNEPEWFAVDWAVQHLGLVMVALYADDSGSSMAQMLADSGAKLALVKDAEDWISIRQHHGLGEVQTVVLRRGAPPAQSVRACAQMAWLPDEDDADWPESRAQPQAMCTIVYTSGATGIPKGVMLSHANVVANVFACLRAIPSTADDLRLSVLPLAHMFERCAGAYVSIASGAATVFGRGPSSISADMQMHRPTVLVAVPRVYEKIHALIAGRMASASAPRRALFQLAVETGWRARQPSLSPVMRRCLPTALTHRVSQQLAEHLGGRLRLAVSGGAALSPDIARTLISLGLPLLQGYGLSEASPVVSTNRLDDNEVGSSGRPLDNIETRIGPDGELLVRGPSVMMGYWRDKAATEAAVDAAGWLHTGDKVSRLDSSHVYLVGRIKEIIVTATGEKACPALIETRLRQLPLVDQVMVVGEARPYLGALIVPDVRAYAELCAALGVDENDVSTEARDRVEAAVLRLCADLQCTASKNHYVRRIALIREPWTVARGLLTPSMKLRRAAIAQAHPQDIERLYRGHVRVDRTDCSCNSGLS